MIKGLGIEIIEVPRFKLAVERWGRRLLTRLFTEGELEYCMAQRRSEDHLAARYCVKLSYMKAIGSFVSFKDIEITRDEVGRPSLKVSGLEVSGDDKTKVSITMSHDGEIALAETLITTE